MKIDFSEIKDWRQFENLIADFFRQQHLKDENNIINVFVQPSGIGSDGGRDLLVTFKFNDSIVDFQRKWVVQSKFYNKTLSKSHIADVNIPTLIHEYGADGYILICKGDVSSKLSEMFEHLCKNCRFGYQYSIWDGNQFAFEISLNAALASYYFPKSSLL